MRHVELSVAKPVSYLPINTIENVIGISLSTYASMVESKSAICLVFRPGECCISSGAAYAFLPDVLCTILRANSEMLTEAGIPHEPANFIEAIARTWFEDGSSVIPLLKKVFGED